MNRLPPRSTRPDPPVPYTTPFRSAHAERDDDQGHAAGALPADADRFQLDDGLAESERGEQGAATAFDHPADRRGLVRLQHRVQLGLGAVQSVGWCDADFLFEELPVRAESFGDGGRLQGFAHYADRKSTRLNS